MYENPRGLSLVLNNGIINYLCSSKCRKNQAMKRRKVRWVAKLQHNKDLRREKYVKPIVEVKVKKETVKKTEEKK
jgi:ribosomal protein L24E